MSQNEIEFTIRTDAAEAKLQRLKQLAQDTQAFINGQVANGVATPEFARSGMAPGPQQAAAGVAGTASPQVTGPPGAVRDFNRDVLRGLPGLSQDAYQSLAGQYGVSYAPAGPSMAAGSSIAVASTMAALVQTAAPNMQSAFNPTFGAPGQWTGMAAQAAGSQYGSFTGYQLAQIQAIQNLNNVPSHQAAFQRSFDARTAMSPIHRAQMQAMGVSLGYMGVQGIAGGLDYGAAATRSGGSLASLPGEGMGLGGTIGGGMIGLGLGALTGNPALALLGAMGGATIGSSAMRYLAAPYDNAKTAAEAIGGFRGSLSDVNRGYTLSGELYRLQEIGKRANAGPILQGPQKFDERSVSPEMGRAYSSIYEGLWTGGIDPFRSAGSGVVYSPGSEELQKAREIAGRARGTSRGIQSAIGVAMGGIGAAKAIAGAGVEQVGETYLRRLATIYGNPNVAKMAESLAPVFGSLPETGGNVADMLTRFGPTVTSRYLRIQNDDLVSSVPSGDLMHTSAVTRGYDRAISFGSLQVRGGGGAIERAARGQMGAIASLPGGRDSLAYAESWRTARGGSLQQFGDDLTTRFGIPQIGMNEEIARANFRPYAPGETFRARAGLIRSQLGEAGAIDSFVSRRGAAGELSVDEESSLRTRAANARISAYGSLSEIAMGAPNMMGGIAAAGAFGGRLHSFTGMQQASAYLNPYAFFRRDAGFSGGRASNRADSWLDGMGVPSQPHSRSESANNPMMGSDPRVVALLERIARALDRGAGSFQRPNRGPGDLNSQTNPRGWGGP